jgi:Yip1-like protein
MGRGRTPRDAQQQGRYPQATPPGPYGAGADVRAAAQQWPQAGGGNGEPEYFGEPAAPARGPSAHRDPYADGAGHTQPYGVSHPYGRNAAPGHDAAPPAGPRLHWKELLGGIVMRPNQTFWQMRDHAVWGPALLVTLLYGLLALFGLDQARQDVINATFANALQYVLGTAVAVVLMGFVLGAVTHTLARQFGGDGAWAPTIGLSMLIMSLSDAPRLLLAMFLGGDATLVQVVGWATWLAAAALFTSMVGRSHDLPWPRALGASAVELIALLALIKLGTL